MEGRRLMARPQPDVHFMRLSRDLAEAWGRAALSRSERKVLDAIVRASYGFNSTDTGARASYANLERLTGVKRSCVANGLRGLKEKGVVRQVARGTTNGQTAVYAPVKNWETWTDDTLPPGWTPLWGSSESDPSSESAPSPESAPRGSSESAPRGSSKPWTPEKRTEKRTEKRDLDSARVWTVYSMFAHFEGRPKMGGIPPSSSAPLMLIEDSCSDAEVQEKVDSCRGRRLPYFLACFDRATGRPKPAPGRSASTRNPEIYISPEELARIREEAVR